MMKHLKTQRGAIDIILVLVVLVMAAGLGGYVYYRQHQAQQTYDAAGSGATVAKKVSATAGWKDYTSTKGKFSLKYDPSWKTKNCNDTDAMVYLAPTEGDLAICGSDFGGQMMVGLVDPASYDVSYILTSPDFTGAVKTNVTIDGATGYKITAKVKSSRTEPFGNWEDGTTLIFYILKKGDRTYAAKYTQYPSGHASTNLQAKYETMIKTLKFQ